MKKIIFVVGFLILSISTMAQAESTPKSKMSTSNDFLKRFIGTWKGKGKVAGLDSKVVMIWENTLDNKFVKLSFRNEMKRKDGVTQLFEGVAYYKAIDDQKFQASWFDSGGEFHPIDARIEENSLNSLWGTEATKLGRTIYRLVAEKKMEVVDSIRLKDGTWREFGRVVYERN